MRAAVLALALCGIGGAAFADAAWCPDLKRVIDLTVAKEPLIVFVGRLMPHKGVNDLVAALPDGMSLELIGRPYDERFHADVKRLAVGTHVTFVEEMGEKGPQTSRERTADEHGTAAQKAQHANISPLAMLPAMRCLWPES